MRLTKIKLFGEALKVYLLCASIIGAALWAWHTFSTTQRENIYPKPIVESILDVALINNEGGDYIRSEVTLINNGNDFLWVELYFPSLSISKVDFVSKTMVPTVLSRQKYQAFKDNVMAEYGDINEVLVSPKSNIKLVYLSRIPEVESTLFKVAFLATYRHEEFKKMIKDRGLADSTVFTIQESDYISLTRATVAAL